MELDDFKPFLNKNQEKKAIDFTLKPEKQAIEKIIRILVIEASILSGMALVVGIIYCLNDRAFIKQFSLYIVILCVVLICFLIYFLNEIKKNEGVHQNLREVLLSQIKVIKTYIKIYYGSTFVVIPISLIVSDLIIFNATKFVIDIPFFIVQCLLILVFSLWLTQKAVRSWLDKYYAKPLQDLEETLRLLDE